MNEPIFLNLDAASVAPLERAGIALHGEGWKHKLADDLAISLRGVRRMAEGQAPIPPGVWRDLRRLLLAHSSLCRQVAADLPTGDTP